MATLFEKLNLKDETTMVVLDAPSSFEPELAALRGVTVVRSAARSKAIRFAIAFCRTQAMVDAAAAALAVRAAPDAKLWFAYPKQSSRRYQCDFNRDTGWDALGRLGYEGVRQVSIDEDWSALRFRQVAHIKSMTRDAARAKSVEGKARLGKR
ncbi:hypothetical protein K2X89_16730 [Myxococcota bacterium]|nr:hypothetical protein [Myxococcota bacterium]